MKCLVGNDKIPLFSQAISQLSSPTHTAKGAGGKRVFGLEALELAQSNRRLTLRTHDSKSARRNTSFQ